MIFRHYSSCIIAGLLFLFLIINFYFIGMIINNSETQVKSNLSKNLKTKVKKEINLNDPYPKDIKVKIAQHKINEEISLLPKEYFIKNQDFKNELQKILQEMNYLVDLKINDIFHVLKNWTNTRQLLPSKIPELGTIIETLRSMPIRKSDTLKLGTQLKLLLTFEKGLKAVFKPQWYTRDTKITGTVYNGKDRHNAEVVAFYLSLLLSFRRVPLALIRKVNLKEEVYNSATPELLSTMYQNGNSTCFYGICHYCTPDDPICGIEDILEGTVILWLPDHYKLVKLKNPWQRTYTQSRLASWEVDMNYCEKVKQSKIYSLQYSQRLLDLIDTAIFDFLMDNGDRHHYEIAKDSLNNPAILLIDNGKSLGNPDIDHIDILAPLYQCCIIRKTTWRRLRLFGGGALSFSLYKLLAHEAYRAGVHPILTREHLHAIDRRLLTVFATVEFCIKKSKSRSSVILD